MSDMHSIQASEDFSKARGRAFLSRIQHFLDADKDRLLSFSDVKEILKPKNETYRGMRTVSIDLIVGSEGRYRDFTKFFLPKADHLRSRWERVDMAHLKDIILPPIQLYEIGGVYFVRDGNHRVSVARMQGTESIDAEVTSLSSEIRIDPSMDADALRRAVVQYEKDLFYEKTSFGELTECDDMDFTAPGRYDVIYNHILVHKYYLNERANGEIGFADALVSWYNNVYKPIIDIIIEDRLYSRFPGRTPSDLYVWIVKHWDFLKRKYGVLYSVTEAARDFSSKYGKDRMTAFREAFAALARRIFGGGR
ncbi:MAG: transcriptional regulator [Treponema sp. GWB1_62_6]|nr:MAG: transcriptional regulator [Treponema sp. GWA1_62_8]OHE62814.1 MAG: transcriptional regulator [Treponema sp. GWC1_61_84]OHE64381.1 MAG: transcriptional regulator [Treponema sp. GWB1_62_6]OHE76275.1 MAG: transcriptional regulator [Treponema sp. RIFOXYC1_FULL_61_9]HCM28824.1 transcriptional regulator [Treponema sp.]